MSQANDIVLLQRFEPVIRFTRGEQFFPMDVAHYVNNSSLWVKRPNISKPQRLRPKGSLTLQQLGQSRQDSFGSVFFLKFAEPLTVAELAGYKIREGLTPHDPVNVFRSGGGRLARVGYLSRFVDAAFSFSLLARGRLPGDAATAAAIKYQALLAEGARYRYYGRVVRQESWLVLQYWFFYATNNWRSGFYGMNDHEGDWEMICIYLSEVPNAEITPEWVAYASHDLSGDDLRRHWDDPELEKVGEHPVVYAGAGSHASYFTAGDYLVELEIPFLTPLARFTARSRQLLREKLRQYYDEAALLAQEQDVISSFRMPFVDYARGDGLTIGPDQGKSWEPPMVISRPLSWVTQYRGLWGLYTQDPWSGEDAPAGPMYNRNGTVRRAWYDPVGWAGLNKFPPRNQALARVIHRQIALEKRRRELCTQIEAKSDHLVGLGVEAAAMQNHPHLKQIYLVQQEEIDTLTTRLDQLRAEFSQNEAKLEALEQYSRRLEAGDYGALRNHIRRASQPIPETDLRMGRLLETWAAISTGLMLISLVALIVLAPENWLIGLVSIGALFLVIESTFHQRLTQLVTTVTIVVALIATLVLFFSYFPLIATVVALLAGAYMIWQNLNELW